MGFMKQSLTKTFLKTVLDVLWIGPAYQWRHRVLFLVLFLMEFKFCILGKLFLYKKVVAFCCVLSLFFFLVSVDNQVFQFNSLSRNVFLFFFLTDFLTGKHFFLYGEFPKNERRMLIRYITAFNGWVVYPNTNTLLAGYNFKHWENT